METFRTNKDQHWVEHVNAIVQAVNSIQLRTQSSILSRMLIILGSFNSLNSDNAQKGGIWQQQAMYPTGLSPPWLLSL